MHETFGARLRGYHPQEIALELLGRTLPYISPTDMAELWISQANGAKLGLLRHVQALAALSLDVLDQLEVLPRAAELSRLFGMDILSSFTRGSQLR
eukprot:3080051-Amphidinium_carterae.1